MAEHLFEGFELKPEPALTEQVEPGTGEWKDKNPGDRLPGFAQRWIRTYHSLPEGFRGPRGVQETDLLLDSHRINPVVPPKRDRLRQPEG
jgi:hypothetical protein